MKLKIKNGFVYDEDVMIAVLTDYAKPEHERAIQMGSESVDMVEGFVNRVNTGSFRPRHEVKEFEKLLHKYA